MQRVAVVDYGMGNLRSVAKAIEHAGEGAVEVIVTGDPQRVRGADRVVFPGQGHIRDCMEGLRRLGLDAALEECFETRPFLGICVGEQALMERSEEDHGTAGFGLFRGEVHRFPGDARHPQTGERLKVPHMGWSPVRQVQAHPLWRDIPDGDRFYFVHSYYVEAAEPEVVAGETDYALTFHAAVARGRVFAVQFHPEKSARAGLQLLKNFLAWNPA